MKAIIAYGLVGIGVPQFIGLGVWSILTHPISSFLRSTTTISSSNLMFLEIVNGFIAALTGAFLFRLFGFMATHAVPIMMAACITYYYHSYRSVRLPTVLLYPQLLIPWVSWLAGLLIGWMIV